MTAYIFCLVLTILSTNSPQNRSFEKEPDMMMSIVIPVMYLNLFLLARIPVGRSFAKNCLYHTPAVLRSQFVLFAD